MLPIYSIVSVVLNTARTSHHTIMIPRLDKLCQDSGRKVRMTLGDAVHVLSYNSTISNTRALKCHLELAVTNSLWGFSVYIQEISLGEWEAEK